MKRITVVALAVLGVWACGQSAGDGASAANDRDTLTRRQKDSIIATMPIPGSRGVGRALDAQDASRERAAALDSILQGR
ncbi:MAG: hypothetical protein FJ207_02830 [Gemmatimonadetes bacterium]|nr:hypothetical protein [Gemmatimonadota bacterium]